MFPPDSMSSSAASPRLLFLRAYRWAAVVSVVAVWMLGMLAASPQLHASLHSDADRIDHSCAVTLFSHGVEQVTSGTFVTGAPMLFPAGECAVRPALPVAAVPGRFPPGRGPPRC